MNSKVIGTINYCLNVFILLKILASNFHLMIIGSNKIMNCKTFIANKCDIFRKCLKAYLINL